jgi:ligand-binding sensor domain-containing protein
LSNEADEHNLSRYNKGLHCFEDYKLQDINGKTLPTNGRALFEDIYHHLWLGTYEDGLIRFDAHSRVAQHVIEANEAPLLHIFSIFQYDEHRLLIGSNEGLYMYNEHSREGQVYTYDDSNPESVSNQFVCPILRDREGGLWIGTYFGGLNYVHPRTGAFVVYKTSSSKNSLNGMVISSMIEDEESHIWFGSNDGGLSVFSPETGLFETIHLEEHSRLPHNVTSLALRKNEVWVGTFTTGIDVYNRTTHAVRHYPELYDDLDN